jgi:hypothetical protein
MDRVILYQAGVHAGAAHQPQNMEHGNATYMQHDKPVGSTGLMHGQTRGMSIKGNAYTKTTPAKLTPTVSQHVQLNVAAGSTASLGEIRSSPQQAMIYQLGHITCITHNSMQDCMMLVEATGQLDRPAVPLSCGADCRPRGHVVERSWRTLCSLNTNKVLAVI